MHKLLQVHSKAGIHVAVACSACVMTFIHGWHADPGYVVRKFTTRSVPYLQSGMLYILSTCTRKCIISHIAVRVLKLVPINAHGGAGGSCLNCSVAFCCT